MASADRDQADGHLHAFEHTIDELHRKLAASAGVDKDRLQKAVDKYKAAHKQFHDDALACMN